MDERVTELEKLYAFHEQTIADLNEVIVDQQKRIETLETVLKNLQAQVTAGDLVKKQEDETPPPHY